MTDDMTLILGKHLGHYRVADPLPSSAPYYHALLHVLGPMKPGSFWSAPTKLLPKTEEYFTEQMLEELIPDGYLESVEMLKDGSIKVWQKEVPGEEQEFIQFSSGTPHIAMLEKYVGPLNPGDRKKLPEDRS